jgi:hypothetical protein
MFFSKTRIESMLNGAIIAAAVGLMLLFMKDYGLRGRDNLPLNAISPGASFALKDIQWAEGDQTLVLALSKGCHFCSDSAPFYQKIAAMAKRSSSLQVVAVLPQGEEDSRDYLSSLGVSIENVKQASFDTLGVGATPTLILVDAQGRVIRSWVGELSPDDERRVLDAIAATDEIQR